MAPMRWSGFGGFALLTAALSLSACTNAPGSRGPTEGTEYCDVIQDYVLPDDCTEFAKQAARQTDGTAAFNAPNPLERGESFTVWLAVAADPPKPHPTPPPSPAPSPTPPPSPKPSPAPSEDASAAPVAEATDNAALVTPAPPPATTADLAPAPEQVVAQMPGHVQHFSVTVGEFVAADLQGDDSFEIKPLRDRTQRVHLAKPYPSTVWGWQVTPKRGGDHMMTITTVVQVKDRQGQFWDVVSTPHSYGFHVKVGVVGWIQDTLEGAPFWLKLVTGVVVALSALIVAVTDLRKKVLALFGIGSGKSDPPDQPSGGKP